MISLKKMILRSTLFAMTVMLVTPLQVMASRDQWIHQNTKTFENGCQFSYLRNWRYDGYSINDRVYVIHISICNNNHLLTHVTEENTGLHYYPYLERDFRGFVQLYGGFDQENASADIRALLLDAWQDFSQAPECRPSKGCHDEL